MMKKFAVCLAAVLLAASAVGCGSGTDKNASSGSMASSISSEISSEMSSISSAVSSDVSSNSPSDGDAVSVIIKDETLKKAYDAVRSEFGEFFISMPSVITEQQMKEMYYVNPDDVEEFVGEMSIANVSGDTFVGVKAKPGQAQAVAAALEKRRADIMDQFKEYPVNFMDIKSEAAKVVTQGDYVFLILMGNINVPDGQEASLEMAQKEVDRAEKAILSVFGGASASESSSDSSK